ncbi:MAG: gliding motility-associated C-terminal domain-containing protein [Flavobacteriales bacterium]
MNTHWSHIIFLLLIILRCNSTSAQITFVENLGQWDDRAEFRAEINGAFVYLGNQSLTYSLYEPELMQYMHPTSETLEERTEFNFHAYEVQFLNCNALQAKGEKQLSYFHNYYLDSDPENWASNVKSYEKIRYADLYDGVDMVMYQGGNALKYDFIVHPHQDPSQIKLQVNGADDVKIENNQLHISTSVNKLIESEPYTYQFINGKIIQVECSYQLRGNKVSFKVGKYNPEYKLIIDPELLLASTTGSNTSNFGFTATYDQDENLVAGGNVFANGFPTTLGAFQTSFGGDYSDAFITKFNDDGSQLLYSTYIGGSENERPHSLITTLGNDIYVMGTTGSSNFPTTAGAYDTSFNAGGGPVNITTSLGDHDNGCDIFVAKINGATGALMGCTYVGGSAADGLNRSAALEYNYADVFRGEIIVDENDDVYVTTSTSSTDFPTSALSAQSDYGGGTTDGIVFKMNSNLTVMQWSTYYGGTQDDSGYSLQPDSDGNLYLVGGTRSSNLPTTSGVHLENFQGGSDGYIVKLDNIGSTILAATYIGTGGYDQTYFVQLDPVDDLYVLGQTTGNYPISGNVYSNENSGQFIHKFTNDLQSTIWSTRVGTGSGFVDISPTAFLVSDCNKIFLTGWGGQTNQIGQALNSTTFGLPITPDAYQSTTDGSDFYLLVLEEEATELLYATYFGGNQSNEHVDGGTSKFSKDGVVYQAVCSGCGSNSDFPTTSNAWSQTNNTSNCDLGVFKFNLGRAEVEIGLDAPDQICLGEDINLTNLSDQELAIEWDFGNDETSAENNPTVSYEAAGTYTITLTGNDNTGCLDGNIDQVEVEVIGDVAPEIIAPTSLCAGESAIVEGIGSENANWIPNILAPELTSALSTLTPDQTLTIELNDFNACSNETVEATIEVDELELEVDAPEEICLGTEVTLTAAGGSVFEWTDSENNVLSEGSTLTFSPESTASYSVYSATDAGCEGDMELSIEVVESAPGGENYGPLFMCENVGITLTANNGDTWLWTPGDFNSQSITVTPETSQNYEVLIINVCGEGIDEVTVEVGAANASVMEPDSICFEESIILSASGGVAYQWLNLNTNEILSGTEVTPLETTDYQVTIADQNGCLDSAVTTIIVMPLPLVDAGPNVQVMFLDTAILQGSVSEETFWWTSHEDLSCLTCLYPTVYPSENHWYFLNTIDEFGCTNYDGVLVEVTGPLFVPNSFTPNGDGFNDVFMPQGLIVDDFTMQIFNRWGELIFESNDPNVGWNGTYKGHEPIIDTYTWRIQYKDYRYGTSIAVGHVTIIE